MLRMTKSCPTGKKVLHHVADDLLHLARVEDVAADGEQQHDKGKEREDGVGSDTESVGVDLGARHVAREGDDIGAKTVGLNGGLDVLHGCGRQLGLVGLRLFGLIGTIRDIKGEIALADAVRLTPMLAERQADSMR